MLGLQWYEADRCPGCGKSLSLTTQGEVEEWLATMHTCHACEMLSIKQRAMDTTEHKHTSAYVWSVERQT